MATHRGLSGLLKNVRRRSSSFRPRAIEGLRNRPRPRVVAYRCSRIAPATSGWRHYSRVESAKNRYHPKNPSRTTTTTRTITILERMAGSVGAKSL
jgi:hypothetical protein